MTTTNHILMLYYKYMYIIKTIETIKCLSLQGSIFFSERGLSTWWVIVVLTLSLPGISHFVVKTIVESQMSICYVSNSLKSIIPHIPSHHLKYHLQDLNLLISQL